VQQRFEDLGTPLIDVEFVVLDFETTGGSPADDRVTEVGAVKIRGGEVIGTFQTLVAAQSWVLSYTPKVHSSHWGFTFRSTWQRSSAFGAGHSVLTHTSTRRMLDLERTFAILSPAKG
jgi:hypothetical protein